MSDFSTRPRSGLGRALAWFAYWFNLIVQPVLAVAFVIGLAWLFGYLQRNQGWFNDAETSAGDQQVEESGQFACSMLCVIVKASGRCPVCGMELQKIESTGDPKDIYGLTIDPVARRLAKIETVAALNLPVSKATKVLGQVAYDETTEATIAAYVEGRIENLRVDYTGATVKKGEALAVLYSPDLYADQVGVLQAKAALKVASSNQRVQEANRRLYRSARQRLMEQGLAESQVDAIEASNRPSNRIEIFSPAAGTVVNKMVDEGEYVKTGTPILKIADLSSVWLMLEMYSEDSSQLQIGQEVEVSIQSQVGKKFAGRVAFIDPMVDPKTQTVKVRVVVPNESGLIKIGDLGSASVRTRSDWQESMVVLPRESVLINGENSVAYVETKPGRFEFRKVKVAEIMGDRVTIVDGIKAGEQVVASGAFMLDSTFNIQGKVSLIDPDRAVPQDEAEIARQIAEAKEIEESFRDLSPADRKLSEAQVICPVSDVKLGTKGMGVPIRVDVDGESVMICCEGCRDALLEDPEKHFAVLATYYQQKKTDQDADDSDESKTEPPSGQPMAEPDSASSLPGQSPAAETSK